MLWFSLSSRTNFCLTLTLLFACREPHLDAASVCCHCMPRLHNAPRDFEDRLNLDFKNPLINLDLTPNDHLYGNYYHQFSRTKHTSVPPWIWELVRSYSHYYTTTYHMHHVQHLLRSSIRASPQSLSILEVHLILAYASTNCRPLVQTQGYRAASLILAACEYATS